MASSGPKSSIIQFDDGHQAHSELQFEDFSHGDSATATLETSKEYSSFSASPDLEEEKAELLSEEKKSPSVWEFSYYQSFFNVDTDQVIQRIFGFLNILRLFPFTGTSTYLDRIVRPTPDLYGPFWISTTLIFSTAISGNIAEYFVTEGQDNKVWHFNFHKVSLAATAIYSYTFLLPLAFWGLLWYRQSTDQCTLLEIICVYGYSLFIYIPSSILWVIHVPWLHVILVSVAAVVTGIVLVHTFLPAMRGWSVKVTALVTCLIILLHILLAVGLVAYFFQTPHWHETPIKTSASIVTPAIVNDTKLYEKLNKTTHELNANKIGSFGGKSTVSVKKDLDQTLTKLAQITSLPEVTPVGSSASIVNKKTSHVSSDKILKQGT